MKLTKIAFGVALAAGTMAAQADSILFPYVVNGGSVTTIVHIIDTTTDTNGYYDAAGNVPGNRLHYTMVNKSGANATSNSATCGEVDYYLPHSPFDLQSIDLGARFSVAADKGVLFNDPGVNNNWKPAVSGALTYAMAAAAGGGSAVRGYLVVDNANVDGMAGSLTGEAMVFDFSSGAAWGYKAAQVVTAAGVDNVVQEFDYSEAALSGNAGAIGGVSVDVGDVSFMPLAETTTRFFVTPLNRAVDEPAAGAYNAGAHGGLHPLVSTLYGSMTTEIRMATNTGVAYDRDENLVSGTIPQQVTCVGAVDISSLLSPGAAVVLANGGWGHLETRYPGGIVPAAPAVAAQLPWTRRAAVIKLDFNSGGVFNGQPTSGTYNNAFQL